MVFAALPEDGVPERRGLLRLSEESFAMALPTNSGASSSDSDMASESASADSSESESSSNAPAEQMKGGKMNPLRRWAQGETQGY
jgi:hypothetical protein